MMPGTRLPKGRSLAESAHLSLTLREPVLVFVEGHTTSMREENILAGEIYEIRLITPHKDLLVAYSEECTVEDTPSNFNPHASVGQRPTLKEFIEVEMEGASR